MSDKIKNLALALYDALEEENYQAFCAMLNWMFDLSLHYYAECIHVEEKFKGITREVRVRDGDGGWTVKNFKAIIKFKEVKRG
jgi:hypothetical protein